MDIVSISRTFVGHQAFCVFNASQRELEVILVSAVPDFVARTTHRVAGVCDGRMGYSRLPLKMLPQGMRPQASLRQINTTCRTVYTIHTCLHLPSRPPPSPPVLPGLS